MQVSVQTLEGLERQMDIVVEAAKVDSAYQSRLSEVAKTAKLDGYRPGKVPVSAIEKRYGDNVRFEAVDKLMREAMQEAFMAEKLMPASQPSVEKLDAEKGADLKFSAIFEVFPEINLKDLAGATLDIKSCELTDSDIDGVIEKLRKQHADFSDVERAAKEGDQVVMDFAGKIDDKPMDRGDAKDFSLILGSGQMIPGFEDGLTGMKAGEQKAIEVTFPKDYHATEIAGKKAVFDITVNKVQESSLPEVDDKFVEKFGVKEGGIEAFKKDLNKHMSVELKTALNGQNKQAVFDKLLELNDIAVPKALVKEEAEAMFKQMHQQGNQDKTVPAMTEDEHKRLLEPATRRVKLGLLFREGLQKLEVKADAPMIKAMVEDMASSYDNPEEYVTWYMSDKDRLQQVEVMALEQALCEKLQGMANVNTSAVTYDELISGDRGEAGL
jgi:trigger factor